MQLMWPMSLHHNGIGHIGVTGTTAGSGRSSGPVVAIYNSITTFCKSEESTCTATVAPGCTRGISTG
jgi:hypothetical protein